MGATEMVLGCAMAGLSVIPLLASISWRPLAQARGVRTLSQVHRTCSHASRVGCSLVVLQAAIDQLEEDRNEENRQHRGADHAADHAGANVVLAAGAGPS